MNKVMKFAAIGAAFMGATTVGAYADQSSFPATAQTGETAGLARGAPLPEGVYFVNTLSFGDRKIRGGDDVRLLVNIPVIAWSTPWQLFGGNIQIIGALPMAHVSVRNAVNEYGLYNPFLAGALAYDLGGGLGVSYLSGFYFNLGDNLIANRATTWRQDFAISYTDNGWNLTANLIWGITFDTDNAVGGKTANGFNLDLTATKTFGKWEVGAVAFGSTEYDVPDNRGGVFGNDKRKQFAIGPLVGYNAGGAILQAFVTRDVYARNIGSGRSKETRFWTRVIIPFVNEAPTPLVTKY